MAQGTMQADRAIAPAITLDDGETRRRGDQIAVRFARNRLAVVALLFFAMRLLPGDPLVIFMGQQASSGWHRAYQITAV